MKVAFKVKGLEKLISQVRKMPVEVQEEVDTYMTGLAFTISETARINAANIVGEGFLKGQIVANTSNFLDKTVSSNAIYSAYVEFGTGPKVSIPSGLESFAAQFKGKRPGNSRARPFFFPAYFQHGRPKKVEKEIKKLIEGMGK